MTKLTAEEIARFYDDALHGQIYPHEVAYVFDHIAAVEQERDKEINDHAETDKRAAYWQMKAEQAEARRVKQIEGLNKIHADVVRGITQSVTAFVQERDQAREALRAVEWSYPNAVGSEDFCLYCRGVRSDGHTPNCIVGKALPAQSTVHACEVRG